MGPDQPHDDLGDSATEPAEFLRRAVFCERFAATLTDRAERAHLLDLATRWRRLAEEAKERQGR